MCKECYNTATATAEAQSSERFLGKGGNLELVEVDTENIKNPGKSGDSATLMFTGMYMASTVVSRLSFVATLSTVTYTCVLLVHVFNAFALEILSASTHQCVSSEAPGVNGVMDSSDWKHINEATTMHYMNLTMFVWIYTVSTVLISACETRASRASFPVPPLAPQLDVDIHFGVS